MLGEKDTQTWLLNLDEETQATLTSANDAEGWPLDDDPQVKDLLEAISEDMQLISEQNNGDVDYSVLSRINAVDLVKLHGQLGYIKGIKLFGDALYVDEELAMSMLSLHKNTALSRDIDASVSSSLLARRLSVLVRFQLISRIFSNERSQLVINALRNHFAKGVEANEDNT
ncbi:hypothetical protein AAFX24_27915 [Vibrio mediterranei]|uniref:type IVB secretion system protein IcmW n=1 Tax=Vibrio mediterranei TaxID=689 RepID=UPI0038CE9F39